MFYVRKIKWEPAKVIITDFGPFKEKEDAKKNLYNLRKKKHTDYSIVEKNNDT